MATRKYPLTKRNPVATFYYQGPNHSHPVRRTILRIVEPNRNLITGYELREGNTVRSFSKAPIKSYRKDRIATNDQCGRRLRARTPRKQLQDSTLQLTTLESLVKTGV